MINKILEWIEYNPTISNILAGIFALVIGSIVAPWVFEKLQNRRDRRNDIWLSNMITINLINSIFDLKTSLFYFENNILNNDIEFEKRRINLEIVEKNFPIYEIIISKDDILKLRLGDIFLQNTLSNIVRLANISNNHLSELKNAYLGSKKLNKEMLLKLDSDFSNKNSQNFKHMLNKHSKNHLKSLQSIKKDLLKPIANTIDILLEDLIKYEIYSRNKITVWYKKIWNKFLPKKDYLNLPKFKFEKEFKDFKKYFNSQFNEFIKNNYAKDIR